MLGGFKAARRKVRLTPEALTRSYYLDEERKLPLVIEPSVSDLDPVAWAARHQSQTRKILNAIHPDIRDRFSNHGYMYARNFGEGFGLPWQETFQTPPNLMWGTTALNMKLHAPGSTTNA